MRTPKRMNDIDDGIWEEGKKMCCENFKMILKKKTKKENMT